MQIWSRYRASFNTLRDIAPTPQLFAQPTGIVICTCDIMVGPEALEYWDTTFFYLKRPFVVARIY